MLRVLAWLGLTVALTCLVLWLHRPGAASVPIVSTGRLWRDLDGRSSRTSAFAWEWHDARAHSSCSAVPGKRGVMALLIARCIALAVTALVLGEEVMFVVRGDKDDGFPIGAIFIPASFMLYYALGMHACIRSLQAPVVDLLPLTYLPADCTFAALGAVVTTEIPFLAAGVILNKMLPLILFATASIELLMSCTQLTSTWCIWPLWTVTPLVAASISPESLESMSSVFSSAAYVWLQIAVIASFSIMFLVIWLRGAFSDRWLALFESKPSAQELVTTTELRVPATEAAEQDDGASRHTTDAGAPEV